MSFSSNTNTNNVTASQYPPQPINTQYLQQASSFNGSPTAASGVYGQCQQQSNVSSPQMMVHTPYSCQYDLVPSNMSEAASVHGGGFEAEHTRESMLGDNTTGMQHTYSNGSSHSHSNNGSFRGRRSNGCSSNVTSPQPAHRLQASVPSFDPWTGQYDGNAPSENATQQSLQRPRGNSHHSATSSGASHLSSHSQTSSFRARYGQHAQQDHAVHQHHASANAQPFPAFMMRAPIMDTPVHSAHLGGKVEYLEMPQGSGAEITTAAQWNRAHKVFIGHVKFEISADGLRWIIYMLTGVQAGKVEVRGMGCFMVFFANAEDVFRVRGLHKRVIFDVQGIWFAQNLDQEHVLHHYAANVAPGVHAKLPKGLMVVDEETSRRRTRKHKSPGNTKLEEGVAAQQDVAAPAAGAAFHAPGHVLINAATAISSQDESAHQMWSAGRMHSGEEVLATSS